MTCTCGQLGQPRCPDGEELYQAYRKAMEAEIDAENRYQEQPNEVRRLEVVGAARERKDARQAWVGHKSERGVAEFRARLTERERE